MVQSVELKFNCFLLMPVVDAFPSRLRAELEVRTLGCTAYVICRMRHIGLPACNGWHTCKGAMQRTAYQYQRL